MFIRPKIDKNLSSNRLVDFSIFLETVFPDNELHRRIASAIIQYIIEHKEAQLKRDIVPYIRKVVKLTHARNPNPTGKGLLSNVKKGDANIETVVSATTICRVWLTLLKSGIISKHMRWDNVELSVIFSKRLRDLADYWENYFQSKVK